MVKAIRWTDEQLAAYERSFRTAGERVQEATPLKQSPKSRMNKTEAAYGQYLETLKHAGEVLWYGFEAIKLRLAGKTYYTPDYLVLTKDWALEVHEVKGFWRDDARVKIKVAAETFPFRFKAVTKLPKRGGWRTEEFPGMFHMKPLRSYADVRLPAVGY